MTPAQKILIKKLLTGNFLRKMKRKGKSWYVLYDAKVNPLMKVRSRTVEKLDRFMDPELKLWKENKHGDLSLNLSTVRQLHGRSIFKKMYKHPDKYNGSGSIYKSKKKVVKPKEQNEKVNYLF